MESWELSQRIGKKFCASSFTLTLKFYLLMPGKNELILTVFSTSQLTFTGSMSTIEILKKSEICSKLTLKSPKQRQLCRSLFLKKLQIKTLTQLTLF